MELTPLEINFLEKVFKHRLNILKDFSKDLHENVHELAKINGFDYNQLYDTSLDLLPDFIDMLESLINDPKVYFDLDMEHSEYTLQIIIAYIDDNDFDFDTDELEVKLFKHFFTKFSNLN